jgi:hypothetical protein
MLSETSLPFFAVVTSLPSHENRKAARRAVPAQEVDLKRDQPLDVRVKVTLIAVPG